MIGGPFGVPSRASPMLLTCLRARISDSALTAPFKTTSFTVTSAFGMMEPLCNLLSSRQGVTCLDLTRMLRPCTARTKMSCKLRAQKQAQTLVLRAEADTHKGKGRALVGKDAALGKTR